MPAAAAPQTYDPTNQLPSVQPVQLPDPTPAMPSPISNETPQINGAVKQSGAIAMMADGILRGFMQGRSMAQASKVMKLKKRTDDLQASYNQDAQRLVELTHAGYNDPSATPEQKQQYAQAKSAVDGSWGALMDFYGQHIEEEGKGKGGKKSKGQNLKEMLTGGDPMQVSQAWYQIAKQSGPPVLGQIAMGSTKEAQTYRQASQMGAENTLEQQKLVQRHNQAQKDYDELAGKDPGKMTDAEKTKLANARAILYPPRQTGASYLYQRQGEGGKTEYQRFRPDEVPEEEGWSATPTGQGSKKLYASPDGKEREYYAPGEQPQGWQPDVKTAGGPKEGSFGAFLTKQFGPQPTGSQYLQARKMWAAAGHVAGSGRGGGAGADKTYQKWAAYYKEHYPQMSEGERDTLARRKTEGASQMTAGGIGFDAETQPQAFDSDVINQAIENLQKMPQYGGANPTVKNLGDALANIVGIGDNGYVYHNRSYIQEHGPDSHGKFSGDVTEDQLKGIERDLQNQIRIILSKQTGLPPEQKRAAAQRMLPLFTPAANFGPEPAVPKSGTPGASPRPAATPTPSASSPAAAGAHHPKAAGPAKGSKGEVWKSDFLKANQGATDADWQAMKTQLEQEGYATKDQ